MTRFFVFPRCPNCGQRSFFFRFRVYRCRACFRFCCEKCVESGWFHTSCPHCHARSSVTHVGYTR